MSELPEEIVTDLKLQLLGEVCLIVLLTLRSMIYCGGAIIVTRLLLGRALVTLTTVWCLLHHHLETLN